MRSLFCQELYEWVGENSGFSAEGLHYVRVENLFHQSMGEFDSWGFLRLCGNVTRTRVGYRLLASYKNTPCTFYLCATLLTKATKWEEAVSQGEASSLGENSVERWIVPRPDFHTLLFLFFPKTVGSHPPCSAHQALRFRAQPRVT